MGGAGTVTFTAAMTFGVAEASVTATVFVTAVADLLWKSGADNKDQ